MPRKLPWIRLHRSLLDSDRWFQQEALCRSAAWIDLLLLADDDGRVLNSSRSLAVRWKWHSSRVDRFLATLRVAGDLAPLDRREGGYQLLHWADYQARPRRVAEAAAGAPVGAPVGAAKAASSLPSRQSTEAAAGAPVGEGLRLSYSRARVGDQEREREGDPTQPPNPPRAPSLRPLNGGASPPGPPEGWDGLGCAGLMQELERLWCLHVPGQRTAWGRTGSSKIRAGRERLDQLLGEYRAFHARDPRREHADWEAEVRSWPARAMGAWHKTEPPGTHPAGFGWFVASVAMVLEDRLDALEERLRKDSHARNTAPPPLPPA